VSDVQPGYVMVGDERIDAVVTLWAAGVQPSPLGKLLGVETDKKGCVLVDEHLNPKGHPEIFVCGDLAHVEQDGRQFPGVAQPAMQMGAYAARRIGCWWGRRRGRKAAHQGFRYFDKGDMATIGRKAAIAKIVMAVQGALERLDGVARLADGAHLLPHRLPQPPQRLPPVGLDLPDAAGRRPPDHRIAGPAGLERCSVARGWTAPGRAAEYALPRRAAAP
jgi:hypothetical protein